MSNPLLVFWAQIFGRREPGSRIPAPVHIESSSQASSTIFLIMRRMRAPLITLITIFSISVVGLTLIPVSTRTVSRPTSACSSRSTS